MSDRAFPIFAVADLEATRHFYEQLGFEQTFQFPPDGEPGYIAMELGDVSIGIARASAGDAPCSYWIYVDDVDATLDALRANGATVVEEPVDQPWGERVARVRDPAGTIVHVGSRADDAQRA